MPNINLLKIGISEGRGRGVFAAAIIEKGEMFESAPVIVIPSAQLPTLEDTVLYDYYFNWGAKRNGALALGYGSLYNHSFQPNAYYSTNIEQQTIEFYALREIRIGEEITIDYNGGGSQKPIWFTVKE